jgi:hypothetical protein
MRLRSLWSRIVVCDLETLISSTTERLDGKAFVIDTHSLAMELHALSRRCQNLLAPRTQKLKAFASSCNSSIF